MTYYAAHSREFDFQNEWYAPLRRVGEELGVTFVFPHETTDAATNTKERMTAYNAIVAEVSYPSTGLGIELGWAETLGLPIYLVCRESAFISRSVLSLTGHTLITHSDQNDLVAKLVSALHR